MKRNWDVIRQFPCGVTKNALAVCSDTGVLSRLQQAFPECFEKGDEEKIGPWSMIRTKWEEYCAREYKGTNPNHYLCGAWGEAVKKPFVIKFGKSEMNEDFDEDGPIPQVVRDQLWELAEKEGWKDNAVGTKPIEIRYLDRDWIVSYLWEYGSGFGLAGLPRDEGDCEVFLVPKEHIIFDL